MKKTYIEPEIIVVSLNIRDNVLNIVSTEVTPTPVQQSGTGIDDVIPQEGTVGLGREAISTPNAWEEW